ncbi:MAG: hypothetical protein HY001_00455 [Candidatus Portnoybacteria bacterium]|nr:hypothetical protein [Candidatus Portnoybacteria bacterium]
MKLVLSPLANSKAIKLVLEDNATRQQWEEIAPTGDDLVGALDKLLEMANIEITSVETVRVYPEKEASLTSLRLAKTFQQALNIAKSIKPHIRR